MDTTVNQLNVLLRLGVISAQTYADGIDAIASRRERPTPAPRRRNDTPTPAPRRRNDNPTLAPQRQTPIPATRRRPTLRDLVFRGRQWAIGNFLRCWEINVPQALGADPLTFLEGVRPQIRQKLTEEILAIKGVKFQLALMVQLRKGRPDGGEESTDTIIRHKQETLLQAAGTTEINEVLDKAFPRILETLEKWTRRGSGWVVNHVSTIWSDIARYQPLRGGSYIPPLYYARMVLVIEYSYYCPWLHNIYMFYQLNV